MPPPGTGAVHALGITPDATIAAAGKSFPIHGWHRFRAAPICSPGFAERHNLTIPGALNRSFSAFLFDMDGTLLDSAAVIARIWGKWALRHGFDPETFIRSIHGVRAIDVITPLGLDNVDPHEEAIKIQAQELEDLDGIVPIAGAIEFLNRLPRAQWAIVTSAPIELAKRRMAAAGIPMPDVIISGEDVGKGKPHPACYLLAAERLGVLPADCLVFEDASAGILAAQSAGSQVAVVTATHSTAIETNHLTLRDYSHIEITIDAGNSGNLSLRFLR